MSELTDPDDKKLVVLARATRARAGAAEGAALRDTDGRTYAAATVDLPSLRLSAVGAAAAMAIASGVRGLEAAVVLGEATELRAEDLAVLTDLSGSAVTVHRLGPAGELCETRSSLNA